MMHFFKILLPLTAVAVLSLHCTANRPLKILVVTGGHGFEREPFFQMFTDLEYDWQEAVQPRANELIAADSVSAFDVLVFYDMWPDITEKQKLAYLDLLEHGKGMVFLHHSLVSYQQWKTFESIIGGKYITEPDSGEVPSTYRHDVEVPVHVIDPQHPVTAGLNDFVLYDEVYGGFRVSPGVTPLLTTSHRESSETIAWCHQYTNARVVYLQSGHDHHAFDNPVYRQLLKQAIDWVR